MKRRSLLTLSAAAAAPAWSQSVRVTAAPASAAAITDAGPITEPERTRLGARLAVGSVGWALARVDAGGVHTWAGGRQRAASPEPPDAETRFEWGSISKTFTALLLARLVVERTFALDDAVEAALGRPLRDATGAPIRWRDLATHRSGLPRLPANLLPRDPADPYVDYRAADLEAFLAGWKPGVARDTRFEYSNLGFGLLGHALARALGEPFDVALRTRVLMPLGLSDVLLARPGVTIARLADGHDAERRRVPHWQFDVLAGAGALVGSARALARYAQAAAGLVATPLDEAFALHQGGQRLRFVRAP